MKKKFAKQAWVGRDLNFQPEQNHKNMERADLTVSLSLTPRAACCAHRGRPVSQLGFLSGMHTFSLERKERERSLFVRAEFPVALSES